MPAGTVTENLEMVFHAIVSGGAVTLGQAQVRARLLGNTRHSLVELPCLLRDAQTAGVADAVKAVLTTRLARERHIVDQFGPGSLAARLHRLSGDRGVPDAMRLRVFVHAACPWLLAPGFALKRWALARRARA